MGLAGLPGLPGLSGIVPGAVAVVPTSGDADAAAFIAAAATLDNTQQTAINNLVTALKSAGSWSKTVAIYPFVGGAASVHSLNLKDPSQFQITWNANAVHSAGGVRATTLNAGSVLISFGSTMSRRNYSISFYFQNPGLTSSPGNGHETNLQSVDFPNTGNIASFARNADNNSYFTGGSFNNFISIGGASAVSGYFANQTTHGSTTQFRKWYRTSLNLQVADVTGVGLDSDTQGLLTLGNNAISPLSWVAIGASLTEAEQLATANAVHAYQQALGRGAAY